MAAALRMFTIPEGSNGTDYKQQRKGIGGPDLLRLVSYGLELKVLSSSQPAGHPANPASHASAMRETERQTEESCALHKNHAADRWHHGCYTNTVSTMVGDCQEGEGEALLLDNPSLRLSNPSSVCSAR